jgi:type IV secretion system protein TrbG
MQKYLAALLICLVPVLAIAGSGDQMGDSYFSHKNPDLTPQEETGISIADRWRASSATGTKAVAGADGSVRFVFGVSEPSIICAVLQVCDVALEPGEQVNNINVGDPRWTVEPAITGYGASEVQHLIIKPQDVGLDTSLVVTTNRRTYHLRLRSHRTKFMPYVTFVYPTDDATKKWDAIKERQAQGQDESSQPESKAYLGNLDFSYTIEGHSRWKPVRVYNDGVKTIIEMPSTMSQTEAPTLLVTRKNKGFFSFAKSPEEVLVNYRVQGDRYIVDSVFDRAILIAGVGGNQDRITITRCDAVRESN